MKPELMGQVVLVNRVYVRNVEYGNSYNGYRKKWWGVEPAEGRPGWVVGERWLHDGAASWDSDYGWEWSRKKDSTPHHCLLVCYWPTMRPVQVPMDGYELAPETTKPYPPVQPRWPESALEFARKEMADWPRDEKGRWRKKPMSKREFIKQNRKQIDEYIRHAIKNPDYKINNEERELWILNDQHLYNWARREGVKL
jgi:hypothetical protein